jgi:glucosyl-3-phosphoglycerate phosphatase
VSRLVLLRHGRTAWNEGGRAQGHADVGLDERGHAQAAAVAPHMAALGPASLWTSDLARARQTCTYVERATGLSAKVDERLREYDVGERQGMTSQQFEATYPEAFAAWRVGDDRVHVPGAETDAQVRARMVPALRECLHSLGASETGVVVTHGAALKVGLLGLLGWPQWQAATLRGIDNCAWVTLARTPSGRVRLGSYNEHAAPPDSGLVDL